MRLNFSYKNALLYEIFERIIISEIFNNASKKFGKLCHTDFLQKIQKRYKKDLQCSLKSAIISLPAKGVWRYT